MKRKGRYTYVPKDEIAEVRTFNDVSFETDDLLDGAYVKGRKKYARGGMPSKRPMSLEEQAAESVGYDTWYMMDAVDQKELVDELVSTGMIAPMFGWGGKMANGGEIEVGDLVKYKKAKYHAEVLEVVNDVDIPYAKIQYPNGMIVRAYLEDLRKVQLGMAEEYINPNYMADGGQMLVLQKAMKNYADGGELTEKQAAIDEAAKIAEFAYMNDITASGNSLEEFTNKIFEASGISYAKAYLQLAYDAMRNIGYADGGVTGTTYVVKYSMKDNPEVIKENIFEDKDEAEMFLDIMKEDEDVSVMPLQEIKPAPAPAPKKSLFATAKPAPATAASKKKRERVEVDGIADEIARYDQLKATINNAKAEQEVIGGRLKEIGREKFLDLYEQRGVRPANFDLADGSENILLEVTDKYLKVEPEKAELLRQYSGLLEEKTTYEFDSELLEKEVSEGMTIGDVVSMLIQDSKLIPESDKPNLIKAKMSMRVPKGTIDRLMDYENPREVFSLISPILALK